MAKTEDYATLHGRWGETRATVRKLQSDHKKRQNEKDELLTMNEAARKELVAAHQAAIDNLQEAHAGELDAFDTDDSVKLHSLDVALASITKDYEAAARRLRHLHDKIQEAVSDEVARDRGSLASGLGECGVTKEDENKATTEEANDVLEEKLEDAVPPIPPDAQ